jgi:hypothetical protein
LAVAVDLDLARLAVGVDRRRALDERAERLDGLADGPLGSVLALGPVRRSLGQEGKVNVPPARGRLPEGRWREEGGRGRDRRRGNRLGKGLERDQERHRLMSRKGKEGYARRDEGGEEVVSAKQRGAKTAEARGKKRGRMGRTSSFCQRAGRSSGSSVRKHCGRPASEMATSWIYERGPAERHRETRQPEPKRGEEIARRGMAEAEPLARAAAAGCAHSPTGHLARSDCQEESLSHLQTARETDLVGLAGGVLSQAVDDAADRLARAVRARPEINRLDPAVLRVLDREAIADGDKPVEVVEAVLA